MGYRAVRFSNAQVFENAEGELEGILRVLKPAG
jgi:hypothetical protein